MDYRTGAHFSYARNRAVTSAGLLLQSQSMQTSGYAVSNAGVAQPRLCGKQSPVSKQVMGPEAFPALHKRFLLRTDPMFKRRRRKGNTRHVACKDCRHTTEPERWRCGKNPHRRFTSMQGSCNVSRRWHTTKDQINALNQKGLNQ